MPPSPAISRARARVAGMHHGGRRKPDDPQLAEAKRDLEVAKLIEHAKKVAASLPSPTEAQIEKVTSLLNAAGTGG